MLDFSLYPRFHEFNQMSILSIDFGYKVIGTAIYKVAIDPYPLMCQKIIYKSDSESLKMIQQLIESESIEVIVFGIPYYIDGKESDMTKKLIKIANILQNQNFSKKFFLQDETLTTQSAIERMKSSPEFNFKVDATKVDCLSAVIILEDFMRGN